MYLVKRGNCTASGKGWKIRQVRVIADRAAISRDIIWLPKFGIPQILNVIRISSYLNAKRNEKVYIMIIRYQNVINLSLMS